MYNRVDAPLRRPLTKKLSYKKRVCYPVAVYVKFQLSISESSRDMMGPKFTIGALCPSDASLRKKLHPKRVRYPIGVCTISTFYLW